MPKIKMPRSAPSIDMTPMVDLAFLLVTFFMLSANFRTDDVPVASPSSISDKEVPQKHIVMVSVTSEGLIHFGATGEETRKMMLADMCSNYKVKLTKDQQEEFLKSSSFGCPMNQLGKYLDLESAERMKLKMSIPTDSTDNQLKAWIFAAQKAALATGQKEYEDESSKTTEKLEVADFKPKFVLRVDGKAQYARAKLAIECFRDLNINNLHFVTSLEENPYTRNKPQ